MGSPDHGICDCGHWPAPIPADGGASGYATFNGRDVCYTCAYQLETFYMGQNETYFAYVDGDGKNIMTWSGGRLATITSARPIRHNWSREMQTVRAVDPQGVEWYGRNAGRGMCIRLRRVK